VTDFITFVLIRTLKAGYKNSICRFCGCDFKGMKDSINNLSYFVELNIATYLVDMSVIIIVIFDFSFSKK